MRRGLGIVVVVVLAVGAGLGIDAVARHRHSNGAASTTTSGPATTASPEVVPGSGQTFLTGTITSLRADNAVAPPLATPFTITIPVRGAGSASITGGVVVAGKPVAISWYGGQPLPVSGNGSLAIDGGPVSIDASGITWQLDGAPRALAAGQYHLGAPVAVGTSGLATPYQSVSFEASAGTTILTKGGAQIHLPPASVVLSGPGMVVVAGDLQLHTATATRTATSASFGRGSYSINLKPAPGGFVVQAVMQGALAG